MAQTAPEFSTLKNINALIARRIRGIAGDEELQILEAGCGRKWPIDLSGARYRLTGVDLDAKALEARKNEVRDLHEAIVGDLCSIDFPRAHFDVIYSAFVLEHIKGAEEVLEKLVLWLKPGGLLILQVPDRDQSTGSSRESRPSGFTCSMRSTSTRTIGARVPQASPAMALIRRITIPSSAGRSSASSRPNTGSISSTSTVFAGCRESNRCSRARYRY
jgi:SAM-dependent methyltransferase